jgi:hypothetical protein
MMTGYMDGELAPSDRERFETHLQECDRCQRQLRELVAIKEQLDMFKFKEPTDAESERYWRSVYNRLERGFGWILFSLGAIILLCYGGFLVLEEMLWDTEIPAMIKIGVVSLVVGGAALFVSLLRERLTTRKADRYSQEVER